MAKVKLTDYSATAGTNTDIDSINIDEGCAPANLNNAIRSLMSHLKNFISGTNSESLTVGGTLAVTGATTLTGATGVTGNASIGGTLSVAGTTTLTGATSFTSNATVGGNLAVTGTTTHTGIATFGGGNGFGTTNPNPTIWNLYSYSGNSNPSTIFDNQYSSSGGSCTLYVLKTATTVANGIYSTFLKGTVGGTTVTTGSISTDGTGTTFNTSSDRRLKTNIQPLIASGTFIDSFLPRTFTWISSNQNDAGFIADELQSIVPSAVTGQPNAVDEDGNNVYQGIDCSTPEIIANIIAELQALRKRVAVLGG